LIEKVIKKGVLRDEFSRSDLGYWLSKSPRERIEAVEILRKQSVESSTRLQRTIRIIKRA
jgi:hypothetical protein